MDSLVELYCDVDDFCQAFEPQWEQQLLGIGSRQRRRAGQMHLSEMMTLVIYFHQSHYRDFKAYYNGPTGEGTTLTYTYGAGNAGPHAVTSLSDGSVFTYDANGNMLTRAKGGVTWTHIFDAENHLVSVSNGTTTTSYVYDGGGNRIKRTVSQGGTTTTTIYVAGMEIEKTTNGTETKRTIYYGMGGAFLIIGSAAAGLYFRHGDHLSSTSVLSNSSGQAVVGSDVVFAPFGEIRSGQQSTLTDFGFTGQRLDTSTGGMMYYGARYYLPELRRFISAEGV